MTTCPFCLDEMAARSVQQLMHRRAMMRANPQIKTSPCPQCGGTEWATTDYMVDPDPPIRSRWQRIKDWLFNKDE